MVLGPSDELSATSLYMSFHTSCSGPQSLESLKFILHVKCGCGSIHPCTSGEVIIHAGARFCSYTFALEVTCDPVSTPPITHAL